MTAAIVAPKNILISSFMALAGVAFVYSGLCIRILGADFCQFNVVQQQNSLVPMNASNAQNRFYHEDYEKYLNVFVIHHSITGKLGKLMQDDVIKDILDNHDIRNDEEYLNEKAYYDKMTRLYGSYIEKGGENDRRFSCRYSGKEKGYGIYADLDIQKDSIIGVYTGLITNQSADKDYAWVYASNPVADGQPLDISIDSRVFGNFLRFVNHDDDPNTESLAVPFKNRWHRIYVAIRNIAANEEVTVSYGSNYWSTRDYIKV